MKVPEPRKLKSGTWFIQMRLNGVSVPVSAPTKTECKYQAQLIKSEYKAGKREIKRKEADPTLKDIVQRFIKLRENVLSPSTIRGYNQIMNLRFQNYMSCEISKIKWQSMIDDELKVVSEKTVKNSWGLIKAALTEFEKPIPKVRLAAVPVKEMRFLQPDEIFPFLDEIKGDIAEIGILLELHGLRRSEATGLEWDHVDLKNKTIFIQGARVQNKDGEFVRKKTNKNKSSTRHVPIMIPQLEEALNAVQHKTGRVVTVSENTLLRHTKEACKRANVTVIGNHDLRRSFASLGYHLGLSERQIMEWAGWSDYMTMHRIYILVASKDREAAKNSFSEFFQNKGKSQNANQIHNNSQKSTENAVK